MKTKRLILKVVYGLTVFSIIGLSASSYRLKKITANIEAQISKDQVTLQNAKEKLTELEKEIINMDSREYIEKVATEQLGMVKADTIVFREKP